jgi:hypothetical protein
MALADVIDLASRRRGRLPAAEAARWCWVWVPLYLWPCDWTLR